MHLPSPSRPARPWSPLPRRCWRSPPPSSRSAGCGRSPARWRARSPIRERPVHHRGSPRCRSQRAARGVVRAACAGRVVHAGAVASSTKVASTTCGARRVSYLPLATLAVHAGENVRAGARVGTVAAGHGGLHLGVRRERDRFGYTDPMMLLGGPDRPFAPAPRPAPPRPARDRGRSPRRARRAPRCRVWRRDRAAASAARAPLRELLPVPPQDPGRGPGCRDPGAWPVWLGLACCSVAPPDPGPSRSGVAASSTHAPARPPRRDARDGRARLADHRDGCCAAHGRGRAAASL